MSSKQAAQNIRTKMSKPNAVMVNHQMRYKKKGSSMQPNQQIETAQFNTIAGTEEIP